eukprot:9409-Heterococcus_DN1.PRE.7
MDIAALKGDLQMCQYLRSQQCPWDTHTTRCAAKGGHVDVLRWLIANGCTWKPSHVCLAAARGGSIAVLVHMQQQGLLTSTALLTHCLGYAACGTSCLLRSG